MNKNFLNKLFRIYSIISSLYAQEKKIEKFLISSYYIDETLLYTYEYIDFELMYRVNMQIPYSKKVSEKNLNLYIISVQIEFTDAVVFLHEMYKKITDNLTGITEKDILKLNDYYKQTL